MKGMSVLAMGIALAIVPATVVRAQLGGLGEAAKRGATEAVTKDIAERAGLGTPVATGFTPTPAASTATAPPAHSPSPSVAPSMTATTAASPAVTPTPVTVEGAAQGLMEQAGKHAVEEAGKKMGR